MCACKLDLNLAIPLYPSGLLLTPFLPTHAIASPQTLCFPHLRKYRGRGSSWSNQFRFFSCSDGRHSLLATRHCFPKSFHHVSYANPRGTLLGFYTSSLVIPPPFRTEDEASGTEKPQGESIRKNALRTGKRHSTCATGGIRQVARVRWGCLRGRGDGRNGR